MVLVHLLKTCYAIIHFQKSSNTIATRTNTRTNTNILNISTHSNMKYSPAERIREFAYSLLATVSMMHNNQHN